MDTFANIKNTCDDFSVEFEVVSPINVKRNIDERYIKISEEMVSLDEQLLENQNVLKKLNAEIDKLTNHADGIDYMVAVATGILTGLIDVFFVDDFSLEKANSFGNDKVNNFVVKVAQKQGYPGNDLYGATKFLEEKYPIASDKATNAFGGGLQHHLRDFSHHPTIVGLIFSFLTQFTGNVYGTDEKGIFKIVTLKEGDMLLIGKNFPEKITFAIVNWFFHMVSDMAGSSSSILEGKAGTGLPGPLVSLLKEISCLPIFNKLNGQGHKEFSVWISKLFNGTLLGKRDENGKLIPIKFDLRTEIGVMHQLSKQAMPVLINECIIRGFYFIRRFFMEIRDKKINTFSDLKDVDWEKTLPFKNRTVIRMLTISMGMMTIIDLLDAAFESAIKSKGIGPEFFRNMIVKVNFVGIGRFAIAIGSDVKMGHKRNSLRNERMTLMNERMFLLNGKIFYKQAEMWIAAEDTGKTIQEAIELMEKTTEKYILLYTDIKSDLKNIGGYTKQIEEKNKDLIENINDILIWG